jgi:hypothetical protein
MTPRSGDDALQIRQTYLRKRRSRDLGTWRHTAVSIGVGATACWLCVAVVVFES